MKKKIITFIIAGLILLLTATMMFANYVSWSG